MTSLSEIFVLASSSAWRIMRSTSRLASSTNFSRAANSSWAVEARRKKVERPFYFIENRRKIKDFREKAQFSVQGGLDSLLRPGQGILGVFVGHLVKLAGAILRPAHNLAGLLLGGVEDFALGDLGLGFTIEKGF